MNPSDYKAKLEALRSCMDKISSTSEHIKNANESTYIEDRKKIADACDSMIRKDQSFLNYAQLFEFDDCSVNAQSYVFDELCEAMAALSETEKLLLLLYIEYKDRIHKDTLIPRELLEDRSMFKLEVFEYAYFTRLELNFDLPLRPTFDNPRKTESLNAKLKINYVFNELIERPAKEYRKYESAYFVITHFINNDTNARDNDNYNTKYLIDKASLMFMEGATDGPYTVRIVELTMHDKTSYTRLDIVPFEYITEYLDAQSMT